jgi:hypothetical protein
MSGGSDNSVKETPQQVAMVELAKNQVADYNQRFLPLQKNLAEGVAEMGKEGSVERKQAQGMAATETEARFAPAQRKLEAGLAATGGLNSGRAKMAITGLAEDKAVSTGLGRTQADQRIDDAYTAGLGSIMALGQGQKADAIQGVSNIASMSGRQAANDAESALQSRMGNAQLAGNVIGAGFGLIKPGGGGNSGPGVTYRDSGGSVSPSFGGL